MLHELKIGEKSPELCTAVIEIPRGSQNKYEFDPELQVIKLDRVLFSPMFYPLDYGFFPQTLGGDGDTLDVMVLTSNPLFPGCALDVRPVGVLMMSDDKGQDEKIIAVAKADPRFKHIADISDVNEHLKLEIAHFFETYKTLEKKSCSIGGWEDKAHAQQVITECMQRFAKK
ncbi:MAG: inorganic pyrophosphatase [Candidatus Magasanikbacteria bacterium RIFCSPHIGHO2_01_FULL_50_8]|uniref:Inorganic pyrophosphatase n=2 Tax=Candidatus Magasanikiibacteriota TaxID=1752731 RepID=A0A1F6LRF6_9BACT|nr:MAG: inorganic pyrophosphatase [Candidatus Magasanikbacteria bacterium RIFCSPHIGHO2_01_FULL_50_8]OGH67694.1 MAG: inorganic pyrophosphatase [Candidatus Magasanikbacteria bacterium RIFCSPHIGHO2_02_FULL_50_9b]